MAENSPPAQTKSDKPEPPQGCYRLSRVSSRIHLKYLQFGKEDRLYQAFLKTPQFITSLAKLRAATPPGQAGPTLVNERFGEETVFSLENCSQAELDPDNTFFHISWLYQPAQPGEFDPASILTLENCPPNRRRTIPDKEKQIKGIRTFTLEEFHRDDPYYWLEFKGIKHHQGHSLKEIREILGGNDEGYIQDIDGEKFFLSLKPWSNAEPDETYLMWSFGFAALYALGQDHPLFQPSN